MSTTQQLLDAIDTIGPMTIQVQGTINITSKQGVRPNKTIRASPPAATPTAGRTYYSYTMDSAATVPGLVRAGAGAGRI